MLRISRRKIKFPCGAEVAPIAYAVLSFGGFLGLGDKLFTIPWQALSVET
jgi:hypothetical protein